MPAINYTGTKLARGSSVIGCLQEILTTYMKTYLDIEERTYTCTVRILAHNN